MSDVRTMTLRGLEDGPDEVEAAYFGTVAEAMERLREGWTAVTAAGSDGAINVHATASGTGWRCERMAYCVTEAAETLPTLEAVEAWLEEHEPLLGDRDRTASPF